MAKKIIWIVSIVLAILIGLYPVLYFIFDRSFGLLGQKAPQLLADITWNTAFYIHIICGGLALLTGWIQFSEKIRNRYLHYHRTLGKFYVVVVLLSAIGGFYVALFASGGWIASAGFICLALAWFYTTYKGYRSARNNQILLHRKMMTYSFAASFAAVTLRIWLPLLMAVTGNFLVAYPIVAWLCWMPNLMVAYLLTRRY